MAEAAPQPFKKRKAGGDQIRKTSSGDRKRVKIQDARTLAVQSSDAALSKTGELDVSAFVAAREFEIRALEDGLRKAKGALTSRAFQKVPRSLRRRTASHNVKRVPARLRARAKREMMEDNTPTVTARLRPKSAKLRLRLEAARRLQNLNAKSKAKRKQKSVPQDADISQHGIDIAPRVPKIKKNKLSHPEKPPAKFQKRQRCKTWLPTHMFHAKRAHMTPPKDPLWRFSIPLSPTEKCYRPTHRASTARGAIAWDMSYMSTIGLEGPESSLEGALKALGVDGNHAWGTKGRKWRAGSRSLETWMFERDGERRAIAPVTIIWCANPKCEAEDVEMADVDSAEAKKTTKRREIRKIFMRVHPSAFLQLWEELLKVAKIQKPQVMVEDLRFEIGSIDIIGPGSTEALLGALRSGQNQDDKSTTEGSPEEVWTSLAGLTNPASLPQNALLSFNVTDPRLRFPPRTIKPPTSEDTYTALANLLSAWPPDTTTSASDLFSRPARLAASRLLPSQKAINRRKALAPPGQYPSPKPDDPNIPVLAFPSRAGGNARDSNSQAYWTVLLPWKCVKPVWYAIMYYPLSSGGNPRFGGIQEKQQLAFESGLPWFPGDFPGTKAGWEWGERERRIQKHQWERKPKGKRVEFDSLDLGEGRKKGEVGRGWACDWECLLAQPDKEKAEEPTDDLTVGDAKENHDLKAADEPMPPCGIHEVVPSAASSLLSHRLKSTRQQLAQTPNAALATVKINLLYRGTPTPRARIYRLPATDSKLRIQWLSLLVDSHPTASKKPNGKNMTSHKKQSLVYPPSPPDDADMHPPIPGEEDLIGFVTAGGYNLSAGNGTAIAAVLIDKIVPISSGGAPPDGDEDGSKIVWDAARLFGKERIAKLCIVRSAGEKMGRLGQWESV